MSPRTPQSFRVPGAKHCEIGRDGKIRPLDLELQHTVRGQLDGPLLDAIRDTLRGRAARYDTADRPRERRLRPSELHHLLHHPQ